MITSNKKDRRDWFVSCAALAAGAISAPAVAVAREPKSPSSRFADVGLVLYSWELRERDWPRLASELGIHTLGLHAARRLDVLVDFMKSDAGGVFLESCERYGIGVEYELHAFSDLLSRELFYKDTEMFRVDKFGKRNQDTNCCPSSKPALEVIQEKAVEYSQILRPTTNRYFYWADDASNWCACDKCRHLAPSDQATVVDNAIVIALRKHVDPNATLAHLAYQHTLAPPTEVAPHAALFVEFAPSRRTFDRTISDRTKPLQSSAPRPQYNGGYLELLEANQQVFGRESAQILEYWLDASYFSRWQKPVQKLPWEPSLLEQDATAYSATGAKHLRTFALWLGPQYTQKHGPVPLEAFAQAMLGA